ncbi:hypothetical protein LguiA_022813 [Lonicera macranthoides]
MLPTTLEDLLTPRDLFQNVMKNYWNKILAICKKQPESDKEKITRTSDTLLNLAVADGKNEIVQQLVKLIKKLGNDAIRKALGIVNERKNTPLHLAASMGNEYFEHSPDHKSSKGQSGHPTHRHHQTDSTRAPTQETTPS